jgi:isoleucyl-tRNA synthetase
MKQAADAIAQWDAEAINKLERGTAVEWRIDEQVFAIEPEDVEIVSEDIPGWLVQSDHRLTVALDVELDEALLAEGYARELINRIQHLRKEKDFNVTDRIELVLAPHADLQKAVENHRSMISGEVLAEHIEFREGEYADAIDWLDDERIGLQLARSSGG